MHLRFLFGLLLFVLAVPASADYLLYRIPDTNLEMVLTGPVKVNQGGTITYRCARGELHFKSGDVTIIPSPSTTSIFSRRLRKAQQQNNVDEMLEVARWGLHNGLLAECKRVLSAAWKIDPSHSKLNKLAWMIKYLNKPTTNDAQIAANMQTFLKGKSMQPMRSKHFLLMHDISNARDPVTDKSRAEMRLELLEKVYESFFLKFAFDGKYLKPPTEPLQVVLFGEHGDYLNFVSRLGPELKQTAGFYSPKENLSVFYDSATTDTFQALSQLSSAFAKIRADIKRQRIRTAGDFIRFANTIDLLIDIARENEDISTVSHECTHQLAANCPLIPRDSVFVRWIQEGLAAYFESPKQAQWSGIGAVNSERIQFYRLMEHDHEHGSIEFLVSDRVFLQQNSSLAHMAAYGQAWAMTHFLMDKHFDKLMLYYQKVSELPKEWSTDTPDQLLAEFKTVFGDLNALDIEWRRYMRQLKTDVERLEEEGKI